MWLNDNHTACVTKRDPDARISHAAARVLRYAILDLQEDIVSDLSTIDEDKTVGLIASTKTLLNVVDKLAGIIR